MQFRPRLERLATSRTILGLLCLFAIFSIVIFPLITGQLTRLSGGAGLIDTQASYTPQQAFQMVAAYGEQGRLLYAASTLTADLLYPLIYSLFMALVILFSFSRLLPAASPLQGLVYLPFLAAAADLLENASILVLLGSYPAQPLFVAQAAALFTALKWALFLLSLGLTLIALGVWLIKRNRN